jgi:hypothetical protein
LTSSLKDIHALPVQHLVDHATERVDVAAYRPVMTPSIRIASDDLRLDRIDVLHAGRETYTLGERIRAVSTYRIWKGLEPL